MNEIDSENPEVLLRTFSSPSQLNTGSLVLSATQISHRIHFLDDESIQIFVKKSDFERADYQIATYEQENSGWPFVDPEVTYSPHFKAMSFILVGLLVYIYSMSGDWQQDGYWFIHGSGDSGLILLESEYFRLLTSLTLHADIVHLLSNCILGGFLIHFFLGITGNGLGLFAIIATGAAANYINVIAHGPDHHFVGFSTAIFSVIGMLCTINFTFKHRRSAFHILLPIMAGLSLLAFLGSSGERTDLGAHFFGLATGLAAGNLVRLPAFKTARDNFLLQVFFGFLAFLSIYMSWFLAFAV
jgi:rhomboid protease GluP